MISLKVNPCINSINQFEHRFKQTKSHWRHRHNEERIAGSTIKVLFSFFLTSALISHPIEGLICNGMAEFCDLRINQVTFAGTHNSGAGFDGILYYDTRMGLSFPAWSCWYRNHGYSITKQLDNGIRYFDIDTCFVNSGR